MPELNKHVARLNTDFDFGGAGSGGWNFTAVKEYNPATAYAVRNVVIVSPHNNANIVGINNGIALATGGAIVGADGFGVNGDKATAGKFVCIKPPKLLHGTQPEDPEAPRNYTVHVPVWPLPDGNPDDGSNYWSLIGLYPIELTVCIDEVSIPHYVQAQPIPAEFLLS